MQFTYKDVHYKFGFHHDRYPEATSLTVHRYNKTIMRWVTAHTDCTIFKQLDKDTTKSTSWGQTGAGRAYCSWTDNFDPEVGRKQALARALKKAFPTDRSARAQAWAAYFNRLTQAPPAKSQGVAIAS